jgi:pyruvate formate lyase activating enzyme
VDLFLVDVKIMDDAAHRAWTGASNARTLDNLRRLDALNKPLVVRTPVVASVNQRPEQIGAIADFLATLRNVRQYELLPYHPLGKGKHEALGLDRPPPEFHAPTAAELAALAETAARSGYVVRVAGAAQPALDRRGVTPVQKSPH